MFEDNAYGGVSAIGKFMSNENQVGIGFIQSREITLKRALKKITTVDQQLK